MLAGVLVVAASGCGDSDPHAPAASDGAAPSTARLATAEIRAVAPGPDPGSARVLFRRSGEDRFADVRVSEHAREVRVRVRLHRPRGLRTADSTLECVTVALSSP
ncbi:MAG: hypothetical protein M3389_09480, partial [Actinomycetota bacterium]|nr:hypothetical protein [Actinomycetota bacterium]